MTSSALASQAELARITDVASAMEWAGVDKRVWQVMDQRLGKVPNLRVLAYLPKAWLTRAIPFVAVQSETGTGTRTLTPVECTTMAFMWRVARQKYGLDDEDPLEGATLHLDAAPDFILSQAEPAKQERSRSFPGPPSGVPRKLASATAMQSSTAAKKTSQALSSLRPMSAPIHENTLSIRGFSYAGGAPCFMDLTVNGRDSVTQIPTDRWNHAEIYNPGSHEPSTVYTNHGAFIEGFGIDEFDASAFGLSKDAADMLDPQQTVLLKSAREAVIASNIEPQDLNTSATAVYVGTMTYDFLTAAISAQGKAAANLPPGQLSHMLANRISFTFGLHGNSATFDTACSSSLVAIDHAADEVARGRCPVSIALGVCHMKTSETFINRCAAKFLSKIGRSMSFNSSADGYCRGEGYGAVVLGQVESNTQSMALLVSSAVKQDGRSASLTAPHGPSQQLMIREALRAAELQPHDILCSECAANGSALGDPIEFGALMGVHMAGPRWDTLVLNSIKTSKGHTEGASGIAGFIKGVFLLLTSVASPIQHFSIFNPNAELDDHAVVITNECLGLPPDKVNYLGVSAFGFGGTNAHAILRSSSAATTQTKP